MTWPIHGGKARSMACELQQGARRVRQLTGASAQQLALRWPMTRLPLLPLLPLLLMLPPLPLLSPRQRPMPTAARWLRGRRPPKAAAATADA